MKVTVTPLAPRTDARGSSFGVGLPFENVRECQVDTVRPGALRGNSFHARRHELLVVVYSDRWTLLWDEGEGTPVQSRVFEGAGAVSVEAAPLCAHAVRNDGARDLQVFTLGDRNESSTPRRLAEPLTRTAGVDGCRAGWVAVLRDGQTLEARIAVTDDEIVALIAECAVVAIDIPIGLSERGSRACDVHARRFIRHRGSSVFPAPLRPLIQVRDYADANRLSRDLQDRGISKQAFMIYPKVAQIDRVLQRHHELRPRVFEIHPEVSFAMWNDGAAIEASKHTREGVEVRRALALRHFGAIPEVPRGAREDDVLDALAALWTAGRIAAGRSQELGDAHVDVTGLPMRIVY